MQPSTVGLSEGAARGIRKTKMFLGITHMAKLDQEVLRRRAAGQDRDANGQRVNLNRSMILRELIDEKWPDK